MTRSAPLLARLAGVMGPSAPATARQLLNPPRRFRSRASLGRYLIDSAAARNQRIDRQPARALGRCNSGERVVVVSPPAWRRVVYLATEPLNLQSPSCAVLHQLRSPGLIKRG